MLQAVAIACCTEAGPQREQPRLVDDEQPEGGSLIAGNSATRESSDYSKIHSGGSLYLGSWYCLNCVVVESIAYSVPLNSKYGQTQGVLGNWVRVSVRTKSPGAATCQQKYYDTTLMHYNRLGTPYGLKHYGTTAPYLIICSRTMRSDILIILINRTVRSVISGAGDVVSRCVRAVLTSLNMF